MFRRKIENVHTFFRAKMPKASLFSLTYLISVYYKGDSFSKSITDHHRTKTTCFGVINLPLTIEKDAFYDTKTTCFAPFVIVAADARILFLVDDDGGRMLIRGYSSRPRRSGR